MRQQMEYELSRRVREALETPPLERIQVSKVKDDSSEVRQGGADWPSDEMGGAKLSLTTSPSPSTSSLTTGALTAVTISITLV